MQPQFDLVIRGGRVVDGLGDTPFIADVAVTGTKIARIGKIPETGRSELDAAGSIVTPGFVDIHTHYDGQITWENRLAPSSGHGVTTVVMGNCGVGFAPVRHADHELAIRLMEGVEDIPEVVMAAGIPWNWETFPEYMNALDKREADVDFAAQLPHSPLRVYVMGRRGADLEPPTEHDLSEMRRLTVEAMEAGALGVTTSRSLSHRFRDGTPAPSTKTELDELLALAGGLKDAGKGVFQLIPSIDHSTVHEFSIIREIAEFSGRPVSFSLFMADLPGGWRAMTEGLKQAEADGLAIKGQFYPRPIGMLFGLGLSYHPFSLNPSYRLIEHLPLAQKLAAMRQPDLRARLLSEAPDDPNPFFVRVVQMTQMLFALGDPPNYNPAPQESIKARAASLGIDERELIYDELLAQNGSAFLYCPMGNYVDNRFDAALDFFGMSGAILGLGDGGAHYGMICDAAYPTYVLAEYVRKQRIPLQTAISMLARETAAAVGLRDRGIIQPGFKADLNVINLEKLKLRTPCIRNDLPGNGRRLTQQAEGYEATIVSGQITYQNGQPTGALPGRLVRGAKMKSGGENGLFHTGQ